MSNFWLQLTVEGLKVENVEVGKLYTYIEPFEIDVSNAMYINKLQDIPTMDIRARMHRLNHKHFTFKVEVSSTKEVDVWVRVFLGPKYNHLGNEYDLNERRHYFVELDRFPYQGTSKESTVAFRVLTQITNVSGLKMFPCDGGDAFQRNAGNNPEGHTEIT